MFLPTFDIICQHCRGTIIRFSIIISLCKEHYYWLSRIDWKCKKKKKDSHISHKSHRYIRQYSVLWTAWYFAYAIVSRCNRRKDIKRRFLPARNVNTSVKRRGCFAYSLNPGKYSPGEEHLPRSRDLDSLSRAKTLLAKTGRILNCVWCLCEKWQVV